MEKPTTQRSSDQASAQAKPKKAYQAPEIVSREALEFVADVCTPAPPAKADFQACSSGPIGS